MTRQVFSLVLDDRPPAQRCLLAHLSDLPTGRRTECLHRWLLMGFLEQLRLDSGRVRAPTSVASSQTNVVPITHRIATTKPFAHLRGVIG